MWVLYQYCIHISFQKQNGGVINCWEKNIGCSNDFLSVAQECRVTELSLHAQFNESVEAEMSHTERRGVLLLLFHTCHTKNIF